MINTPKIINNNTLRLCDLCELKIPPTGEHEVSGRDFLRGCQA